MDIFLYNWISSLERFCDEVLVQVMTDRQVYDMLEYVELDFYYGIGIGIFCNQWWQEQNLSSAYRG